MNRFFSRDDLLPSVVNVLMAIGPVERLHFSLCKRDVARKGLSQRRLRRDVARKMASSGLEGRTPSCNVLDELALHELQLGVGGVVHQGDSPMAGRSATLLDDLSRFEEVDLGDSEEQAAADGPGDEARLGSPPGSASDDVRSGSPRGLAAPPPLAPSPPAPSPPPTFAACDHNPLPKKLGGGLASQLASSSRDGIRGKIQRSFTALLSDEESHLLLPALGDLPLWRRRKNVLVQSADFFDRVDGYWQASPRDMLNLLDDSVDANAWWGVFYGKKLCCLTRYFGRRIRAHNESKSNAATRSCMFLFSSSLNVLVILLLPRTICCSCCWFAYCSCQFSCRCCCY